MATFTSPTYEQPVGNVLGRRGTHHPPATGTPFGYQGGYSSVLGRWGTGFLVGYTVIIHDADDSVTTFPGATGLVDDKAGGSQDQMYSVAKAGSGDHGKAVFRMGRTYTITAGEDTLLKAAGYTTSTS